MFNLPQVKRYLISSISRLVCEFPHNLPSKFWGGLCAHTRKKKNSSDLRILGPQNFSNQMARFSACLINLRNYPNEKSRQNVKQSRIVNATISQIHCFALTKCEAIKNSQCNYKSNSLFRFRNYRRRRLNPQKATLSFYTTLIPRHRSRSCFY